MLQIEKKRKMEKRTDKRYRNDGFSSEIPEVIKVGKEVAKKQKGPPTTIQKRRKASFVVHGKVKGNRNHYSDAEKMNAVCIFAVSGNSRRVAELSNIPESTIRVWKTTEWWQEILARIHVEEDEELDTKLTKLINKAVEAVNDRIDNGDYVYNPKLNELIRKPINAKDLTIVTAISVDKRELLRGKPTSRTEKVSQDERLLRLSAQFKAFSIAKDITQEVEVIEEVLEEEFEDGDDNDLTVNELFPTEEE
jgi:hypothetical protein